LKASEGEVFIVIS
jgi:coatomer subunit gamma